VDRTKDTAYRLEAIAGKLRNAEDLERQGHRGLAVVIVETAQQMLPEDHTRERNYLEIVKATIWAREGEGSDSAAAVSLLDAVTVFASERTDKRMLADIELARVVLLLAQGNKIGAARAGSAAVNGFAAAHAHTREIEAARELAFQFLLADDAVTARGFSRRAHATNLRLDNDELLIQTCMDAGRIEMATGGQADKYFLQAYEAAYRIDSLGWRNVVIAVAVDAWYGFGDMKACIRWGDRIRVRAGSDLPTLADTGMYAADYITLLAQYFFAQEEMRKGSTRGQEAALLALETIESLPEAEQAEWQELSEKLRGGLLQPEGEK
jgi:hypothetical protein